MLDDWVGEPEITGRDRELLEALIEFHPEAERKKGPGIRSFYVDRAEPKGKCFWLRRTDGTFDNFSFLQCLKGKTPDRTKLHTACREAVRETTQAFKKQAFARGEVRCAETGKVLAWDDAHVDHVEPFFKIADEWLAMSGAGVQHLVEDRDGDFSDRFADKSLADDFRAYHDRVAKLRVVSAFVNMSKGARQKEST